MIICPNCRNPNPEEAQSCNSCGRSLEPTAQGLMARRAPSEKPKIEIPEPKPPSRVPFAIGVVLLSAVVAGGIGYLLFRPNLCEGTNFTSENFGYCLSVPKGWTAQPARVGSDATLDQFSLPKESTTVLVEAVDLTQGTDLAGFSGFVRQKEQDAGLTPGPSEPTKVDGIDAAFWDTEQTSDSGQSYRLREVVVVKNDVGWRITLNDLAEAFPDHEAPFQQMLNSWRFR